MFSVIGTGPGPETAAEAGDASAARSSRPVPAAPTPIPPRNPRRLNLVFFELTRHLPFVRCSNECGQLESSQLYQKERHGGTGAFACQPTVSYVTGISRSATQY